MARITFRLFGPLRENLNQNFRCQRLPILKRTTGISAYLEIDIRHQNSIAISVDLEGENNEHANQVLKYPSPIGFALWLTKSW